MFTDTHKVIKRPPTSESLSTVRVSVLDCPEPSDLALVREIFLEYSRSLTIDLCFQNFEQELARLPGEYSAPRGALLLAWAGEVVAGCGALRPADEADYVNACEMKRLFVRPQYRRFGIGRLLSEKILDLARAKAYDSILLDTLNEMEAARALYEDLGFIEIPPYYHNPIPGAHYLRAVL